jgi:hypothetical protein
MVRARVIIMRTAWTDSPETRMRKPLSVEPTHPTNYELPHLFPPLDISLSKAVISEA